VPAVGVPVVDDRGEQVVAGVEQADLPIVARTEIGKASKVSSSPATSPSAAHL
jgi:hypothetical protein